MSKRSVVIIGGSSGIGLQTAQLFLNNGDDVLITGSQEDKLVKADRQLRDECRLRVEGHAVDNRLYTFASDASDAEAMHRLFQLAQEKLGGLDVLVHVAGISGRRYGDGPLDRCTLAGWDKVMTTNVTSVYLSNHHALQLMLQKRQGVIINVSSVLGMLGAQDHFVTHAYAASRGAVISLSRSAAVYYAKDNIRINTVCPGLTDTPMSQRAMGDDQIKEALTYYQPLSPHIGEARDAAQAIHFLASDEAKFITGVALPVDGGWTAQ